MTPSPQHAEERHARALHRRLIEELARSAPDATVAIEGAGVHWRCTAVRGERSCTVDCFDDDGAEYLISFASSAGRTRLADEAVEAVAAWLSGRELAELHVPFAFIDRDLRSLRRLEAEVIARHPELEAVTSRELRPIMADLHELWFRTGDRSCRVSHYGGNALPDAAFHWDGTELFVAAEIDAERLAPLLARWLCDRMTPSALQNDFPWLEVGPVALAFEQGGVEGEFLASWDEVVAIYDGLPDHWAQTRRDAAAFIARLRECGFDRTLRAGHSLTRLIVSRSRRRGLRGDQAWVAFDFFPGGVRVSASLDHRIEGPQTFPGIDLTAELIDLLERLEARPID
jgi:hypothetical protein